MSLIDKLCCKSPLPRQLEDAGKAEKTAERFAKLQASHTVLILPKSGGSKLQMLRRRQLHAPHSARWMQETIRGQDLVRNGARR